MEYRPRLAASNFARALGLHAPLLRRKPRARSSQLSSLQLDADDHPFVRYRLHQVPTMALWYTLFIKVPTIEGIQTTLKRNGPAVGTRPHDLCSSVLCV